MRFWLVLCVALFLAGCSSHRAPPPNPRLADSITVVANLNEQLRNWRGGPYRYYDTDRNFLHASTSQGVTRSSLDNVYWHKKFWQARRI